MLDTSIEPVGVIAPHRPVRTEITPEQARYIQLKLTTKLNNKQMAEQLGVHYNTITNWNATDIVKEALGKQVECLRKDNLVGMQKLMFSLIREAGNLLDDDDVGSSLKIQLIGQLFSQVGKFSGLEPAKTVDKKVTVIKSIEQMIDCEAIDVE